MDKASIDGEATGSGLKTLVITGFGPFGEHKVNTSWQCVKLLKERGLGNQVNLCIYELPVEYDTVKKRVPELWKEHSPDLMIHVGVSDYTTELTLETQAYNDGYNAEDVCGRIADYECCVSGAENCLKAGVDMDRVCETVNKLGLKTKAVTAGGVGRYLCTFAFFISLNINRHRSVLVHVPPAGSPYTVEELTDTLCSTITCILQHVD